MWIFECGEVLFKLVQLARQVSQQLFKGVHLLQLLGVVVGRVQLKLLLDKVKHSLLVRFVWVLSCRG